MSDQSPTSTPPQSHITPAPRVQFPQPLPPPPFTSFTPTPNQPYFTTPRPPPTQRQINNENTQINYSLENSNNNNNYLQTVPMAPIAEQKETQVINNNSEINTTDAQLNQHTEEQQIENEINDSANNLNLNNNLNNNNFNNNYDQRIMQMEYELQQTQKALHEANLHRAQLECQQAYMLNPQQQFQNNFSNQQLNSNVRASDISKLLSRPKLFDGDSRKIDEWIFSMRNFLHLSCTPPELQVPIAGGYLESAALQWLTHLRVQERANLTSFEKLAALLLQQFRPLDYEADAWSRLSKLTQTGSLSSFNTLFDSITQRLPKLDPSECVRHYREKLKFDLQRQLAGYEYDNIIGIQKAAIRFEALLKINLPRSAPLHQRSFPRPSNTTPIAATVHNVNVSNNVQEDNYEIESEEMNVQLNFVSVPKMTAEIREHCRRNKLCFRCRTAGHLSSACTKFTSSNRTMKPSNPISKKNFQ